MGYYPVIVFVIGNTIRKAVVTVMIGNNIHRVVVIEGSREYGSVSIAVLRGCDKSTKILL